MKQEIAKARADMKDVKETYEKLLKAEEILDVAGKAEVRLEELNKACELAGQELEQLRGEAAELKEANADAKKDVAAAKKKAIEEAKEQADDILAEARKQAMNITMQADEDLEGLKEQIDEARELLKVLHEEVAEMRTEKTKADEALAASREAVKNVMGA